MTTGAWPVGGGPDHVPEAPGGIGSQVEAATGRLGVWTAVGAGDGGPKHLNTWTRPVGQVRPVVGSAEAWRRSHAPPGCRDVEHSRRDPGPATIHRSCR